MADYGDPADSRPYFSGFTTALSNDSGWIQIDPAPVFVRFQSQPVTWLREDGDADLGGFGGPARRPVLTLRVLLFSFEGLMRKFLPETRTTGDAP